MGKANRDRRRAKQKGRERENRRRAERRQQAGQATCSCGQPHGDWQFAGSGRQDPLQAARILVRAAVMARMHGDEAQFARHVAALGRPSRVTSAEVWTQAACRAVLESLEESVADSWQRGWQPAEVVRQVRRGWDERHASLAADAIARQMRQYAAATVDPRWAAQLTAIGARVWWQDDDQHLDQWGERAGMDHAAAIRCAVETHIALLGLPEMSPLLPLPGTTRPGARSAAQVPGGEAGQRMLERVRALLAKAESTEFPEEAEALTARAQQLMARHSIDEALLAATATGPRRPGAGDTSGRRLVIDNPYEAPKAVLLDVIASANRCRAIWHTKLGLSSVVGFDVDLDAVELLFTSLLVQATTAMLAAGPQQDANGRSRTRSFRQAFLTAYGQRIGERLAEAAAGAEQEAAGSAGGNLLPVLAARSHAVEDAFEEMFPDVRMFSTGPVSNAAGWYAGRTAADLAALQRHREVAGDAA